MHNGQIYSFICIIYNMKKIRSSWFPDNDRSMYIDLQINMPTTLFCKTIELSLQNTGIDTE